MRGLIAGAVGAYLALTFGLPRAQGDRDLIPPEPHVSTTETVGPSVHVTANDSELGVGSVSLVTIVIRIGP